MAMKKTGLLLAIGLCSMTAIAQAADLVLNNNTSNYVTSWLNDSMCSNLLGDDGITKPNEQNHVITSGTMGFACLFHEDACKADIYTSDNCTGDKIATIVMNTRSGSIVSLQMHSSAYQITNTGFNFTLNPV